MALAVFSAEQIMEESEEKLVECNGSVMGSRECLREFKICSKDYFAMNSKYTENEDP